MPLQDNARRRISVMEKSTDHLTKEQYFVDENSSETADKGPRFGCRYVQSMLLCLALVSGIGTRTNIAVAVVAMTDKYASPNPNVPTYDWNNTSVIISSFFWTYISLQVLAGHLGRKYGPKYFLFGTSLLNFFACAAIPFSAARLGSHGVIACRIVQGMCQGFLYPSIQVMMGTWIPKEERATLNNLIFAGVAIGGIYSTLLTGYISASWWGWTYSFYILSLVGFLWCILWLFFGHDSPAKHPRITKEEKKYIQSSLKQEDDIQLPTPWKQIFTCVPLYAILIAYVGNLFGYAVMTTEIPTYLAKVMSFDVKRNAINNAIPTAVSLLASMITGPASDWLIQKQYLSTLNTRRFAQIIGSYGNAICLIWMSFLSKDQAYMAVIILSFASTLTSFVQIGCNVNHLDLSPRFSGVIFGILNAIGQLASVVAPLFVQFAVTDTKSIEQWRTVFIITAGFFITGASVFYFLASATRQTWDGPDLKDLSENKKKQSSAERETRSS
ncbi:hypothetical protein D910_05419 [Dendroctonus ponderosae]|uniref:Major facilitator superfamily (MFS) profile domain-containing protein n=1 Tax=Dendroctonus ponderosae TaxID=77166 RepID=U4UDN1_DENPD|nr:hypothetical protein D910_05419 [Dendroctonus ponderosae]